MVNQVYQRGKFKVYRVENGFILHNSEKHFSEGHTHLDSMKQCRMLIQVSIEKRLPRDLPRYLLISLYRINEGAYTDKIEALINNKKKKQTYVNVPKK